MTRATLDQQRDELECRVLETTAFIETKERLGRTAPEALALSRTRLSDLKDAHRTLAWLAANAPAFKEFLQAKGG